MYKNESDDKRAYLFILFNRLFKNEHFLWSLTCNTSSTANLAHRVRRIFGSIIKGHAGHLRLPGGLIKSGTLAKGWAVKVKGDRIVDFIPILHPMEANGVVDVGDRVFPVQSSFAHLFHSFRVGKVHWACSLRPPEADFVERSWKALHDAVRVRVVVDLGLNFLGPAEDHQVVFAVSGVHEVSSVSANI